MAKQICKDCGYQGKSKKKAKGNMGNEISLWVLAIILFVLFPPVGIVVGVVAVLYSLYRMVAPCEKVCPQCSHKDTMIPLDSPVGEQMAKQFSSKEKQEERETPKEVEQKATMSNLNLMDRR